MSKKNLYVVTGGAGFIGSNIVAALDARNADVVVVDVMGVDDKWRNLAHCRLADLVAPADALAALEKFAGRVESVIHMGAISSTTERDVDLIIENNFRYSCRLWEWCAEHEVPFIYASSAATYGDGSRGFEDRDDMQYLAGLRPLNAYGWSKHLFDRWVCDRIASGGPSPTRWAGLKFFNVFGPNEVHKGAQRSVAVQIFEQIQKGAKMKLFASGRPDYPDGGQMRDFVWVGDCADIALWFADAARPNGLYNVGSGVARSFADLAGAVFKAMALPSQIEYIAMPDALRGKYQYFTQATMTKLEAAGYPKVPTKLEEGVRRYVQDYLARGDFYR